MKFKELLILSALLSAGAANANLVGNGNFSTGNLTDWTVATTSNGTLGAGYPVVTTFNVSGTGASTAAELNVGEVLDPGSGIQEGGSLSQNIVTGAGLLSFSADIASSSTSNNASGGNFSVLLDGVTLGTYDIGSIGAGQVERGVLSFSDIVSAGTHDLEILITRPWGSEDGSTPLEFVNGVTATSSGTVPEPASLALVALGLFGLGWSLRKKA